MKMLCADFVLPISSEPIENGAVVIEGESIAFVGTRDSATAAYPQLQAEEFSEAAILPGFINCHSHLELTALRGGLDDVEHDFRSWLIKINGLRSEMSEAEIEKSAVAGALEGAAAGVTCFGDIGRNGKAGLKALKEVGLRGVVFQETEFSPDNRTSESDFAKLAGVYESLRSQETKLVLAGLSPHSPYTVGSKLFELIAQYSMLNKVPLTIHAAESRDEDELLTNGTGFFSEFFEQLGFDWQSPNCSPIEYLERLGVLSASPLLAHCVVVSESDISKIRSSGASIAHCPKSNAKFGHGFAPFEKFLDSGIAVGLGSDSVASNNVCDLLEESRFAALAARNREGSQRFISAKEALTVATLGGAKALGLDRLIGTLEPGKQADLAVVALSGLAQKPVHDVEATLVFSSNARDVARTIVAGNQVWPTELGVSQTLSI